MRYLFFLSATLSQRLRLAILLELSVNTQIALGVCCWENKKKILLLVCFHHTFSLVVLSKAQVFSFRRVWWPENQVPFCTHLKALAITYGIMGFQTMKKLLCLEFCCVEQQKTSRGEDKKENPTCCLGIPHHSGVQSKFFTSASWLCSLNF